MKENTINLKNEEFVFSGFKKIDSKFRLNLGQKIMKLLAGLVKKTDSFQVFVGSKGDILLRPSLNIPACEVWVYRDKNVLKRLRAGFKDINEGRIKEIKEPDKFFDSL